MMSAFGLRFLAVVVPTGKGGKPERQYRRQQHSPKIFLTDTPIHISVSHNVQPHRYRYDGGSDTENQ